MTFIYAMFFCGNIAAGLPCDFRAGPFDTLPQCEAEIHRWTASNPRNMLQCKSRQVAVWEDAH